MDHRGSVAELDNGSMAKRSCPKCWQLRGRSSTKYRQTGDALKVAAEGAWNDDHTYEMQWRFYETPHHDTITCRFDGDQITIEFLSSIAEMVPAAARSEVEKRAVLKGHISTS
jgi:hypothetical protein